MAITRTAKKYTNNGHKYYLTVMTMLLKTMIAMIIIITHYKMLSG